MGRTLLSKYASCSGVAGRGYNAFFLTVIGTGADSESPGKNAPLLNPVAQRCNLIGWQRFSAALRHSDLQIIGRDSFQKQAVIRFARDDRRTGFSTLQKCGSAVQLQATGGDGLRKSGIDNNAQPELDGYSSQKT